MDVGGSFTERLLRQAGIPNGSKALDVGCGSGDVTLRLAKAVGEDGDVLGIDVNASVLSMARRRADDEGLKNVSFVESDLQDLAEAEHQFDVVTCRRVLMYLANQVEAVSSIRSMLRPGGCLILHEHDASILHSNEMLPLYEQARAWMWDTVRAEGANTRTGFALYGLLSAAGFSQIDICAEAVVLTPSHIGQTAAIVGAMANRIEAAGVATKAEMDVETLEQRLIKERDTLAATTVGEMMFGAIARR